MFSASSEFDLAIIGGGPAGSTAAALFKKYRPEARVVVLERERFPRDHVGESLLPPISPILVEMGCWDKVEGAGFPIKLGATYRWGKNPELWDFSFIPAEQFREEPRPAPFTGQRTATSFQVDRSIYDLILLDHAASLGCDVLQETQVTKVLRTGDRVDGLELRDGGVIASKHYIDASGNSGILRRAMGVECDHHPALQNIAIWDYWQNAEWAVKIGVGGTRIQVRSLPYGWLWFIPMGPTRTSVGLVVPAEYYKSAATKPAELYLRALQEEKEIASLLKNASCEERLQATRDWSFLARRHAGENWLLVGECAGFADPILSAGITMAHMAGQQAAYTINEIESGGDARWLKSEFEQRQKRRIETHIRFADFWYTSNLQFKELKEFTAHLAESCGLDLSPDRAWAWMAQGGFIDEDLAIGIGGFDLATVKESRNFLADLDCASPLETCNVFELDLTGAHTKERASYLDGRVGKTTCYVRGDRYLPVKGPFEVLIPILQVEPRLPAIFSMLSYLADQNAGNEEFMRNIVSRLMPALEGMVSDGWVKASYDPTLPLAKLTPGYAAFNRNRDHAPA